MGKIIAGDIRIILDIKLRKIFFNGPKFGESYCPNFEKAITRIVEGIDDCINTWCTIKRISKILEWKTIVIK